MRSGSGSGGGREQTQRVPGESEEGREGAEVQTEAEANEGGGPTASTTDCCAEGEDGDGKRNGRDGDQSLFHFSCPLPGSVRGSLCAYGGGCSFRLLDLVRPRSTSLVLVKVVVVVLVLTTNRKGLLLFDSLRELAVKSGRLCQLDACRMERKCDWLFGWVCKRCELGTLLELGSVAETGGYKKDRIQVQYPTGW